MSEDDHTLIDRVPHGERPEVQARMAGDESPRTPTLTVSTGPLPGQYVSIAMASRAVFIGRDATCEFCIEDPSVSRRHSRVYIDSAHPSGSAVVLQDLGSTNGTRVNGKEVDRMVLEHGDRILVGDVLLRFEMLDPVDIAYRDGMAKKVEEAERDPLTGLLMRSALDESLPALLERCQERGWPVSVVMMDLDHFKQVNDSAGHQAGDGVLKRAAEIAQTAIRKDDMAIRFGGEEFVMVLAGARRLHARLLAERLRESIANESWKALPSRRVTASFGVAERAPGESVEQWLDRADQALYRAKERGRNRSEAAPMPPG